MNCETIRPFQGNDEMKGKVMVLLISFRNANVALNIRSVPRFQFILNINIASLDSVVLGE